MSDEARMIRALDEVFQFKDGYQRMAVSQQYSRSELVAQSRKITLKAAVREVEDAERAARERMSGVIDGYIQATERRVLKAERGRAGVVGPVQMGRRYAAFVRIDDKALLIKRLEQTLAFIEAKIRSDRAEAVAAVYDAAGLAVLDKVALLGNITVSEPASADVVIDEWTRGLARMGALRSSDLSKSIAMAFDDELGEGSDTAESLRDDEVFASQVDASVRAGKRARLVASQLRVERARELVGRTVEPGLLPNQPRVACKQAYRTADLLPLLDEVKRAFASYRRFVLDNGLFSAFGSSVSSSDCCGFVEDAWSDFTGERVVGTYDGSISARHLGEMGIPELIEEAASPTGDSLDVTIGRMHGFNKRVYHGILDDEPVYFADVFWYGLKKLNQFSEGMVAVDERAWTDFMDKLAYAYVEPAKDLATGMDKQQLDCFAAAIASLGDGAR